MHLRAMDLRRVGRASAFLLLGLVAACANSEPVTTNTINFKLDFGGGVMLTSVAYQINGPNSFRRVGTLPVGDTPVVTATFQNIPAGQGYRIQVKGTASDDTDGCQGQLQFDVSDSMTATLNIPLTCSGLVAINTTFNTCPVIDSLSAIPAEVHVGSSIDLTAVAHDADNGPSPLSPTWATTGGALSNLSTTGATFTCTAVGTFMVGLRISDGTGMGCPDTATVTLTCTPAGA
jgi:hypothetical protein